MICAATKVRWRRDRVVDAVPESRSALATPPRVACSAGESPKRIPVTSASARTNAKVPKSGSMSTPSISLSLPR